MAAVAKLVAAAIALVPRAVAPTARTAARRDSRNSEGGYRRYRQRDEPRPSPRNTEPLQGIRAEREGGRPPEARAHRGPAVGHGARERRAAYAGRPGSRGSRVRRGVAIVASLAVLTSTGVAWATLHDLAQGLTTSNALAGAGASKDGSMNILLIGLDSRKDQNGDPLPAAILDQLHAGDGDVGGYNTNTLIVMHVPKGGGTVSAFSIPRDDYVPVRDIPGNDHVKIKEAEEALTKSGVSDQHILETSGREAGRRQTLHTVQDFLGIAIDQFVEMNLAGFYDLATALGGVDVCLNHPVNDSFSGADFPAGRQTLNGAQALAFVRQRHGLANGDLDRTHRQQAFLAAVTHKLASAGTFANIGKLRSLLEVAKKDVVISSGWDVPAFTQQATNLTGGKVQFATLPIEHYATVDGQAVNIIDQPKIQDQIRVAFGLQPAPTRTATAPTKPVTVNVLNGAGRPGLASIVSNALASGGFTAGTVANSTQHSTQVSYGPDSQGQAADLARILGAPSATADSALASNTVSITLGSDFAPPADLTQQATHVHATASSAPVAPPTLTPADIASGPEGPPIDGGGVPCVD